MTTEETINRLQRDVRTKDGWTTAANTLSQCCSAILDTDLDEDDRDTVIQIRHAATVLATYASQPMEQRRWASILAAAIFNEMTDAGELAGWRFGIADDDSLAFLIGNVLSETVIRYTMATH